MNPHLPLSSPAQNQPRADLEVAVEDAAAAYAQAQRPEERAELRERLVVLALPLADAVARRYVGRGIETDDLVQVARTALVKAAHRYTPGAGAGFAAYATPTVSGELKRWFRDHGWAVRPPRRVQELRSRLGAEEEVLRSTLRRTPLEHELAEVLGVSRDELAEVRACSDGYHAASIDAVTGSGSSLADQLVAPGSATDTVDLHRTLAWAVSRLTPRQRTVLSLRFDEELTQHEVGLRLGVSQMQVSRLLRAILAQLREDLEVVGADRAPQAAPAA